MNEGETEAGLAKTARFLPDIRPVPHAKLALIVENRAVVAESLRFFPRLVRNQQGPALVRLYHPAWSALEMRSRVDNVIIYQELFLETDSQLRLAPDPKWQDDDKRNHQEWT